MPDIILERIHVKGFKSFDKLELELKPINVLIGANGSGKSNFISLFKMLNRMMEDGLQIYVAQNGGPDQILHYGRKITEKLEIELWFKRGNFAKRYSCILTPAEDKLLVEEEATYFHNRRKFKSPYIDKIIKSLDEKSSLPLWSKKYKRVAKYVYNALQSWRVYHFHDTSPSARVKQLGDINDNAFLQPDAGNLAAFLYLLREKYFKEYQNIVETIRLAAPFFGDFILRPNPFNPERIRLEWKEPGVDTIFGPNAFSDGTLRFICLTTLFMQPKGFLPSTIILDEPELGLHPSAIKLLSDMVHSVSKYTQILLATQSVTLVNQFTPEEVLVVDRVNGISTIKRLNEKEIEHWLKDYSIGELWEKNILGGRP